MTPPVTLPSSVNAQPGVSTYPIPPVSVGTYAFSGPPTLVGVQPLARPPSALAHSFPTAVDGVPGAHACPTASDVLTTPLTSPPVDSDSSSRPQGNNHPKVKVVVTTVLTLIRLCGPMIGFIVKEETLTAIELALLPLIGGLLELFPTLKAWL